MGYIASTAQILSNAGGIYEIVRGFSDPISESLDKDNQDGSYRVHTACYAIWHLPPHCAVASLRYSNKQRAHCGMG